jgi:hypothetical protein
MILAVILVIIPIAYFVIAPALAQHIMYTTDIALPNSTVIPCSLPDRDTGIFHAEIINSVKIHVPLFFSAKLQPYKTRLSTTTCGTGIFMKGGYACEKPNTTVIGTYMAPEMPLQAGINHLDFKTSMNLTAVNGMALVNLAFVFPMFQFHHDAILKIESDDIFVTAGLGSWGIFKIPGLKLRNVLTCKAVKVGAQTKIPDTICREAAASNDANNAYQMRCTSTTTSEKSLAFMAARGNTLDG